MAVWYVRDNSTVPFTANTSAPLSPGTVGWSAMTGWAASTSTAPGTLRRQRAVAAVFTASTATNVLTVTAVSSGTLFIGMIISSASNSQLFISALGTGTGGTGTYTLSTSPGTIGSQTWNGGLIQVNARAFIATQSASQNTGTTEPNWTITKGGQTTDSSVNWIECTGNPAVNGDLTNTPLSSTVRSTSPGRGKIILNNAGTHIFIQTSAAGTCGSGEPTYVTTSVGSTTTDNTVTWTYIGTSFSSWAAPFAHLAIPFSNSAAVAGDTIYVGDDHSELSAGSLNSAAISPNGTGASPTLIYSIDHTLSLPVSSSGLKFGAVCGTSGNTAIQFNNGTTGGHVYMYGVTLYAGSGTATLGISTSTSSTTWTKLDNCLLRMNSTGILMTFGNDSQACSIEMINTPVQFSAATQSLKPAMGGKLVWRNTASGVQGTVPTSLFTPSTSYGTIIIENVDLSGLTTAILTTGTAQNTGLFYLNNCKLNSGVNLAVTPFNMGGPFLDATQCSSTSATYIQRRHWYQGTLSEEIGIIRTAGASDGTTGISWKIVTSANAKFFSPFESFPVAIWNATTGADRTVTVYGIWNSAALPNNDDIWISVNYLGDASTPMGSVVTSTKSNNLASNSALSADTRPWDTAATTRQNSHAYALAEVIKVATNTDRVFFCTTAGTSAGSAPGGYSTAVDGGSVTDGTAVFRAGMRFKMVATVTSPQAQLIGFFRTYVLVGKASATFYVDPFMTVT